MPHHFLTNNKIPDRPWEHSDSPDPQTPRNIQFHKFKTRLFYPTSLSVGGHIGVFFCGKVAGAWSWPLTSDVMNA